MLSQTQTTALELSQTRRPSDAMNVPEVALEWLLCHSLDSNVELAHLSNVCRAWRKKLQQVLLEQARNSESTGSPLLLLPSMMRSILMHSSAAAAAADAASHSDILQ